MPIKEHKEGIVSSFTEVCKLSLISTYESAYDKGYEDAIEKAVKWLNDNKVRTDIVGYFLDTQREEMRDEFIEEFKKAMEE